MDRGTRLVNNKNSQFIFTICILFQGTSGPSESWNILVAENWWKERIVLELVLSCKIKMHVHWNQELRPYMTKMNRPYPISADFYSGRNWVATGRNDLAKQWTEKKFSTNWNALR